MIDLIVPTVPGREASLERCIASFEVHTEGLRPIVVKDSSSCGEGWIEGLARSRAPYVVLACDDQECVGESWDEVCVETVEEGFIPCPRVWTPQGAIESQGGDMDSYAHLIARHQKNRTLVDFTTVPFCSREQVEQIGMLPIHYGSDVWISYRGRQFGYETVLRHGYEIVHHQEEVARGAGMGQAERDATDIETLRKELEACEYSSQAV